MDPVTHTLVGVGLANALFRKKFGPPAVPILAIASNLPDIDAAVHLTGDPTAILMRRTFGHSLFLLPIWAFVLAWILGRFYPKLRAGPLYGLVFLGALVHLFFDLVNSFGVVLFWPFSDWRPELGILFIIDLLLTGFLALPLLLVLLPSARPRLAVFSQVSLACAALYVCFCWGERVTAERSLAAVAAHLGNKPDFSYVFPEPLGPQRWRGVLREGDLYRIYLIEPLSGRVRQRDEAHTDRGDPRVERVRKAPLARRIEWFFKAPVWKIEDPPDPGGSARAAVYDLRFRSLVIDRAIPFTFRFSIDPEGRISSQASARRN
jgi:inner membrane protein